MPAPAYLHVNFLHLSKRRWVNECVLRLVLYIETGAKRFRKNVLTTINSLPLSLYNIF